MTQEQKARAYDKVKYIMKEYLESGNAGVIAENTIRKAFPELAESEDERIRKAMINGFNKLDKSAVWYNGITNGQILAWLEKQSKQPKKVSIWKHWKDGIAGNAEGKLIYLVKLGDTYNLSSCLSFECDYIELSELDSLMFEKQGEQKPTPKHKVGDTIYYNSFGELKSMIVANVITGGTDNPMYEDRNGNAVFEKDLVEQKTPWSEDDEEMFNEIILDLKALKNRNIGEAGKAAYQREIDWLNSIKDKIQPQPKWTEENERLFQIIIDILDRENHLGNLSHTDLIACVKKLKSLRPQPQWKPSEQRLKTLQVAIDIIGEETLTGTDLKELLEQLKKLRGE